MTENKWLSGVVTLENEGVTGVKKTLLIEVISPHL